MPTPRKPVVTFMRMYRFGQKEKDPIIDRVHTLMDETGYTPARIEKEGGAKAGTVRNWIDGDTRKPQYANVIGTLRSMGYDLVVAPMIEGATKKGATMPRVVKRFRENQLHHH